MTRAPPPQTLSLAAVKAPTHSKKTSRKNGEKLEIIAIDSSSSIKKQQRCCEDSINSKKSKPQTSQEELWGFSGKSQSRKTPWIPVSGSLLRRECRLNAGKPLKGSRGFKWGKEKDEWGREPGHIPWERLHKRTETSAVHLRLEIRSEIINGDLD